MKIYRQGDVVVKPENIPNQTIKKTTNILVNGVKTGHSHAITEGEFEIHINPDSHAMYLKILSDYAILSHEEHEDIKLPMGEYSVKMGIIYLTPSRELCINSLSKGLSFE